MISRDQHEAIVRTFLSLVEWSDGREDEGMFETNSFSKDEVRRLQHEADQKKMRLGQLLKEKLVKNLEKESGKVNEFAPRPPSDESVYRMTTFRRLIRKARVFEIPVDAWRSLHEATTSYAIDDLSSRVDVRHAEQVPDGSSSYFEAGVSSYAVEEAEKAIKAEEIAGNSLDDRFHGKAKEFMSIAMDSLLRDPFPELTPFEACFFAPSEPIPYLPEVAKAMGLDDEVNGLHGKTPPCCLGMLVSRESSILVNGIIEDGWRLYKGITIYDGNIGQWKEVWATRGPWFVKALVDLINQHKEIIEEYNRGLGEKLLWKKLQKKRRQVMAAPVPFYVVHLSDKFVKEHKRAMFPPRPRLWSHRWDVRGHEAVRIARGALPLPEKTERDLKKRGYRIFTVGELDVDTYRVLAERRQPGKRPGEWLAVLISWRTAYVKGPDDKPYVPAAHRVSDPADKHPEVPKVF